VGPILRLANGAQVELRSIAGMHDVAADDAHGRPDPCERGDLAHVIPHHPDHLAGTVAERHPQELAAVAADAPLHLADEQHLVDVGPVGGLANEHARKVARAADGYGIAVDASAIVSGGSGGLGSSAASAIVSGGSGGLGSSVTRAMLE